MEINVQYIINNIRYTTFTIIHKIAVFFFKKKEKYTPFVQSIIKFTFVKGKVVDELGAPCVQVTA